MTENTVKNLFLVVLLYGSWKFLCFGSNTMYGNKNRKRVDVNTCLQTA